MEIKIEIATTDLAVASLLDLRYNPMGYDEDIWIPVRDRTAAVKSVKIIKLA